MSSRQRASLRLDATQAVGMEPKPTSRARGSAYPVTAKFPRTTVATICFGTVGIAFQSKELDGDGSARPLRSPQFGGAPPSGVVELLQEVEPIASRSPRFRAPRAAVFLAPPDRILMAPKLGHRY